MTPDALRSLLRGAYTASRIPRMFMHWVDGPVGLVSVNAVIRVREMTPWMWEMRFERELAKYWREMKEMTMSNSCPECSGTGVADERHRGCPTCEGTGTIPGPPAEAQGFDADSVLARADDIERAQDWRGTRTWELLQTLRAAVAEIERLRARHDEEADDNATHLREAEGERDAAIAETSEAYWLMLEKVGSLARMMRKTEAERDAAVKRAEEAERKADFLEGERLSGLKLAHVLTVERDTALSRVKVLRAALDIETDGRFSRGV